MPGAVSTIMIPSRMRAGGTLIPDPAGLVIVGGYLAEGVGADEMLFIDLGTGRSDPLTVRGDFVVLPDRSAAVVYVPPSDEVVVLGGAPPGGSTMSQVFRFRGGGDPSGNRFVVATVLPDYPEGPVRNVVATYDPVGNRVIAHGGEGPIGAQYRTTWALSLDPGRAPSWTILVNATDSPGGRPQAMGYDPTTHRAIELLGIAGPTAVYALTLDAGNERWDPLGEVRAGHSTQGELLWDDAACGFHLLEQQDTDCVYEHHVLVVSASSAVSVYRGDLAFSAPFFASALFSARDRELLIFGGETCPRTFVPDPALHRVPL
jgi:hypothetical protein